MNRIIKISITIIGILFMIASGVFVHEVVHLIQFEFDENLTPDCIAVNSNLFVNSTPNMIPIFGACKELNNFSLPSVSNVACAYYSVNEKNRTLWTNDTTWTSEETDSREIEAYSVQFVYMLIVTILIFEIIWGNDY